MVSSFVSFLFQFLHTHTHTREQHRRDRIKPNQVTYSIIIMPLSTQIIQTLSISVSLYAGGGIAALSIFDVPELQSQPADRSLPMTRWLYSRGGHIFPQAAVCFLLLASTCSSNLTTTITVNLMCWISIPCLRRPPKPCSISCTAAQDHQWFQSQWISRGCGLSDQYCSFHDAAHDSEQFCHYQEE